ncbi:MAG: SagB/ThcOx family dehydrogenase [Candidatus Omnitrophota bacterium]
MKIRLVLRTSVVVSMLVILSGFLYAEEMQPIALSAPQTQGGKPLMQALKERKSIREFSARELPLQVLSDLLWAANGINRPESGMRTAPTAKNLQEIDIYMARADGLYLYNAQGNQLELVLAGDIRGLTGSQPFVKDAPINLIFVADYAKMGQMDEKTKDIYAATDTGYISQNVYLYCASSGLATVVRGWVDRTALAKVMQLRPEQRIVLAQTVGYPK